MHVYAQSYHDLHILLHICNAKRNYITMRHKNDKVQNLSMFSQILTSVKEITPVT